MECDCSNLESWLHSSKMCMCLNSFVCIWGFHMFRRHALAEAEHVVLDQLGRAGAPSKILTDGTTVVSKPKKGSNTVAIRASPRGPATEVLHLCERARCELVSEDWAKHFNSDNPPPQVDSDSSVVIDEDVWFNHGFQFNTKHRVCSFTTESKASLFRDGWLLSHGILVGTCLELGRLDTYASTGWMYDIRKCVASGQYKLLVSLCLHDDM